MEIMFRSGGEGVIWLYSKWFDKVFLTLCWLLLIGSILGFVFVGGYILLLFISEMQRLW